MITDEELKELKVRLSFGCVSFPGHRRIFKLSAKAISRLENLIKEVEELKEKLAAVC